MSDNNPTSTSLDLSKYPHISKAQAERILNRFDSIRENRRGGILCYTLAQLARVRLLIEHTDSVDFDSRLIDDGLAELGYLLHFSIEE